jgi:type I restriction enzyme, S subunit
VRRGWQLKRLRDVCEFRGGGTPSKAVERYWQGDIPWVSPKDMKTQVVLDSVDHITPDAVAASATSMIDPGSILMVVRSGILARTVPVGVAGRALAINQDLKALCPGPSIDSWFLFYLLEAKMSELLALVSRGATVHRLITDHIRDIEFNLPPLTEQRRIVAVLDEAFEGIATAKANAEKNLLNARQLFESHAKSVFQLGAKYWPTRTIDRISTNLDSRRVPITKSDRKAGEFPYYGASGIVDYVAEFLFEGDTLLISEDGANLLARSSPIAFPASGRYWVNNHAHIVKFDHMVTQRFVEFFLESIPLDEYITGAAQPKLNQKALNSIPIPIPDSVGEQEKIVVRLEGISEQSELLQGTYERKLAVLDELRTVLLARAFTGALTDKFVDRQIAEAA